MGNILQIFRKRQRVDVLSSQNHIFEYVKASMTSTIKGTRCIDGRYLPEQAKGMLARPGADCGYVLALEAVNRNKRLGLTSEQCFNAIFKAVEKLNGKFYFHTDSHSDPNNHTRHGLIGCGHLLKASRHGFSWEYDVRSKDVREMVSYARNLCEVSDEIQMLTLHGEHREKGVLLITSMKYTVYADNPKLHQMYFVYDIERDKAFMKQLVAKMNLAGVTYQDMWREAEVQLSATLQNLAVGLPLYSVTFEGKTPQITLLTRIAQEPFFKRMHFPLHTPFSFRKKFASLRPASP
jgi:hypothetical protein